MNKNMNCTGRVKFVVKDRGYLFLVPEGDLNIGDIFVHATHFSDPNDFKSIRPGSKIACEYEITDQQRARAKTAKVLVR